MYNRIEWNAKHMYSIVSLQMSETNSPYNWNDTILLKQWCYLSVIGSFQITTLTYHTAHKGRRNFLLSADLFSYSMQTNLLGLWTLNPDMAFKCFFFCMWTCVWRWICRYLLYIFMKYSIVFFYSGVAWRVFSVGLHKVL